jgi:hypothetical protein
MFIYKCYYSNDCLNYGYVAALSCRRIETFRRNILPLSSGLNSAGPGIVHGYWQVKRRMVTQTHRMGGGGMELGPNQWQ